MSIEPGPLLAAIALLGAVAVVIVLPYEQYLLLAILLAYLLYPPPSAACTSASGVGCRRHSLPERVSFHSRSRLLLLRSKRLLRARRL